MRVYQKTDAPSFCVSPQILYINLRYNDSNNIYIIITNISIYVERIGLYHSLTPSFHRHRI